MTYVYGSGRHGASVSGRTAAGIQLLPTVLLGDARSSATVAVENEGYGDAADLAQILADVRRCWDLTAEANGAVAIPIALVNDRARSLAADLRVGTLVTGLVLEDTDLRPYYGRVLDTTVARSVPHCLVVSAARVPLGALLREADIDATFHGDDVDRPVNATVDMWGDGTSVESSVKRGVHNFVVPDRWNTFRWNSGSPSLSWPGGARVSCVGCFAEFRPSLDIQLQIRSGWDGLLPEVTVTRARTVAGGDLSFGLTVEGSVVGAASWRSRSRKLYGPVPLGSASGTVFWIGVVPVYVRPEAEVSLKVALRSVARITARVGGTATIAARLGVDYRRGQRPSTISSGRGSFRPTASFRIGDARSSVTTGIKGHLELEVKVHIYEVITVGLGLSLPAIIVDTHFRHASCNNGPQYEVKAGVDVGTSLTFFQGEIFEGTSVSASGDAPFLSEFTLLRPRLLTSGCFRRSKREDPGSEDVEELVLTGFEEEPLEVSDAPDVVARTMAVSVAVNGAGDLEVVVSSDTESSATLLLRGCANADCTMLTEQPAVTGPALGLPEAVLVGPTPTTIRLSDKPTAALVRSMVGSDTFMVLAITADEDDDDHDGPTTESLPVTLSASAASGAAVPVGSASSYLTTAFTGCSTRCGPDGVRTREARHGTPPADVMSRSCNTGDECPIGDMGVRATLNGAKLGHWEEVPVTSTATSRTLAAHEEPVAGAVGVKLGGATLGKPLTLDVASALCGVMLPEKLALPDNGAPDLSKREVDVASDVNGLDKVGGTVTRDANGNVQIPYDVDSLLDGDDVVTYTDENGNRVVSGKWDWLTYDPAVNDAKARTYNWQLHPSLITTGRVPQTSLHSVRYSEWSTGGCLERTDPTPPLYSTVRRRWQVTAVDVNHDAAGSGAAAAWVTADATFIGVLSLRVAEDTIEELNNEFVEDPGNVYAVHLAIPKGVTSASGEVVVSIMSSSTEFVSHSTVHYELRASLADILATNNEWRTDSGVFLGCRRVTPCASDECVKCGTEYPVDERGRCITEGEVSPDHTLAAGGVKCAGGAPPVGSGFRVAEADEGLSTPMLVGIVGGAVLVCCCCVILVGALCCVAVRRSRKQRDQQRQQQAVLGMHMPRSTSNRRLASRSQSKRSGMQRGARASGRTSASAATAGGHGIASTRGVHRQAPPQHQHQQQPQLHTYPAGTPGAPGAPQQLHQQQQHYRPPPTVASPGSQQYY